MSRSEKLYRRLEQLESELLQAVIRELRDEMNNRPSRYLMRKGPYVSGRQYRTAKSDRLESLERRCSLYVASSRRKFQVPYSPL
jgi:hypothetical protein